MNRNFMQVQFAARLENLSFARVTVASFISPLDPTVDELADIKTAVSEAVTNAIVHGYENSTEEMVTIEASIHNRDVEIVVKDEGKGIENLEQAQEPLFTTKPEAEHSGMGFTIMENFVNQMEVLSEPCKGTRVKLIKRIGVNEEALYN